MNRLVCYALIALVALGCALSAEVVIEPLTVTPLNVERTNDLQQMVKKADFLRAIEMVPTVEARPRRNANELGAIGEAELASGRFDDARRHLRAALDLEPFRTQYAQMAWDLSQLEYMSNNYEASLDWARISSEHGLNIKQWHMQYLEALTNVNIYHFTGMNTDKLPMRVGRPDVPRIDVKMNRSHSEPAVIDSGAVLSIVSRRLASSLPVRSLGTFQGTFYGLLGEPIQVQFGIIDVVEIGGMVVENVPVAIMPDEKMRFLVSDKKEFKIDFLLGANLLKEFRLDLDFRHGLVTFTKLTSADRHPDDAQNLFIEQFRPAVRTAINRRGWFLFVLDTGSEVTFLNEAQLSALPIQFYTPKVHNAMLQGLGGARKHGSKIANVEIGLDKWSGKFRELPMYEADEHERTVGIVGENFLKNFHVTIDFGRMRLDLVRDRG